MDAVDFLKNEITKAIPERFRNLSDLADKAGVNQPNLTELMKGRRKSLNFETAWKLMHALGIEMQSPSTPTIRRMGKNSPVVPVQGDNLVAINVYSVAGAGPAWNVQETDPVCLITAPPSFAMQSSFALLIDGESMYPTIKNGAVVGVIKETHFRQNEIFAVDIPYEGLAVKRVAIDHSRNEYVLRSDNPDKQKYEDIRIAVEEVPSLIVGRVVWVWQGI